MTTTIALLGAGGKMGRRITNNMKDRTEYRMLYVEVSQSGIDGLREIGIDVTPQAEALAAAEVVVLAVPDALIGRICDQIVPDLPSGTMVIGLDPAAGYAGVLPERADITYFITHPCHPPVFNDETEAAAMTDWFGGVHAKQSVVSALHQGPESDYAKGEAIAKAMYGPIIRSHRVTTEQMAILEPALVETLAATCITVIREGMDQVIEMGVPEAAARDFLYGHIRTELAIVFGESGFPFSDGAIYAIQQAKSQIFQPDWNKVLDLENLKQSVREITHALE
ncbi:MAG: NAD(P)-binding domain-containing protein [Caldilineaceae bacterium]|nr:NAD(P)-binding domain-containing protein [Caldilineaceae bacterium]